MSATELHSSGKLDWDSALNRQPQTLKKKERIPQGTTNKPARSNSPTKKETSRPQFVSTVNSPVHLSDTLPKTWGYSNTVTAKQDPNRVTQLTKAAEERSKPASDEEKRKSKEVVEEAKRKLDSQWGTQLGQTKAEGVPTRFNVRPPQRNSFETLTGSEGTSFFESDKERFKTTKHEFEVAEASPFDNEKKIKQLKLEQKYRQQQQLQDRAEQACKHEDQAKQQSQDARLQAKAEQMKQYLEAVAAREARGGIF